MSISTNPQPSGSTPSRLLGAIALRAAAALCAAAGLVTLLVLTYSITYTYFGHPAALGALAGAFTLLGLSFWLTAKSLSARMAREQELIEARKALEREQEARQQEEESFASGIPDLGPWIRLLTAAFPALTAMIAVFGPIRIVRVAIRAYTAWKAYQSMRQATQSPAQQPASAPQAPDHAAAASSV